MAIESLVLASQIHLFNSKSTDGRLVKRSNDLYRLNLHILNLKTPPGKQSSRAVGTLVSLAQEGEPILVSEQVKSLAPGNGVDPEEIGSSDISPPAQVFPATIDDLNTAVEPEEKSNLSDVSLWPESYFDWLDLPLNDQLLFDGAFADLLWNDTCDEGHEYCGLTDHTF
jgi:hypothetical protein